MCQMHTMELTEVLGLLQLVSKFEVLLSSKHRKCVPFLPFLSPLGILLLLRRSSVLMV